MFCTLQPPKQVAVTTAGKQLKPCAVLLHKDTGLMSHLSTQHHVVQLAFIASAAHAGWAALIRSRFQVLQGHNCCRKLLLASLAKQPRQAHSPQCTGVTPP